MRVLFLPPSFYPLPLLFSSSLSLSHIVSLDEFAAALLALHPFFFSVFLSLTFSAVLFRLMAIGHSRNARGEISRVKERKTLESSGNELAR